MSKRDQDWLEDLPEAFKVYRDGRAVDEVECIVPDLAGMSRGKAMPAHKFNPQYETYLPVSIFCLRADEFGRLGPFVPTRIP